MADNSSGSRLQTRQQIPLLALIGPTAVGKTTLAVKIAAKLKTDIISADSAQVYQFLDIGTAKPSEEEIKTARHHLINLVDPGQIFSVADYQKKANQVIKELWKSQKPPFMVGGTGLYISAVIEGYAFGQKGANQSIRKHYEQIAAKDGPAFLYQKLKIIDPKTAATIHPNDKRRIIRALEVYDLEGKPISEQVTKTTSGITPYSTVLFGLYMDRNELYKRIEQRVDLMIEQGWLEEVQTLYKKGYKETDPGMQVLGYRQLMAYLQGYFSWNDAVEEIKKQTRNLAKRQLTWFRRNNSIEWFKINSETSFDNLTESICFKVQDLAPHRAKY